MIYVIGADHKRDQIPHDMNEQDKVLRLQKVVRDLCGTKGIQLVAEEWCDDAKRVWSVDRTHSEAVAKELGIPYLACDPGIEERKRLGMKTREQIAQEMGLNIFLIQEHSKEEDRVNEAAKEIDQRREQYWLDQIVGSGYGYKDVILVCGYGHADSFVVLAKNKGYEAVRVAP